MNYQEKQLLREHLLMLLEADDLNFPESEEEMDKFFRDGFKNQRAQNIRKYTNRNNAWQSEDDHPSKRNFPINNIDAMKDSNFKVTDRESTNVINISHNSAYGKALGTKQRDEVNSFRDYVKWQGIADRNEFNRVYKKMSLKDQIKFSSLSQEKQRQIVWDYTRDDKQPNLNKVSLLRSLINDAINTYSKVR